VLEIRPAVPAKLAFNVRPFGSTAVKVTLHDATPGVVLGVGVHTPLLDRISLTTGEVTVIGPSKPSLEAVLAAVAEARLKYRDKILQARREHDTREKQ
jgi:hypothetical protein